jgi:hypothetical protein
LKYFYPQLWLVGADLKPVFIEQGCVAEQLPILNNIDWGKYILDASSLFRVGELIYDHIYSAVHRNEAETLDLELEPVLALLAKGCGACSPLAAIHWKHGLQRLQFKGG